MALEKELQTYTERLHELLPHEGKFVLIRGEEVVGFCVAYEDAVADGYERFGLQPFLVKRVQTTEPAQFITRFGSSHTAPAK